MSESVNKRLPDSGFVRLRQILGDPRARPPLPPLIPVSKSTWWAGVKDGRFPKPVKLGPRITAWRAEDIEAAGGKFLTISKTPQTREFGLEQRIVLIEFPTYEGRRNRRPLCLR